MKLLYDGYEGSCEWHPEDNLYHGKILNVKGSISYHGKDTNEVYDSFLEAVEFYRSLVG